MHQFAQYGRVSSTPSNSLPRPLPVLHSACEPYAASSACTLVPWPTYECFFVLIFRGFTSRRACPMADCFFVIFTRLPSSHLTANHEHHLSTAKTRRRLETSATRRLEARRGLKSLCYFKSARNPPTKSVPLTWSTWHATLRKTSCNVVNLRVPKL